MKNILIPIFSLVPSVAAAELPLSLESLQTDRGKVKLEAAVSYINSESRHSELSSPIYIQTGPASFISIPTELQENNRNTDMGLGMVGLRYGITKKAELYGNVSYLWAESRYSNGYAENKVKDKSLSNINLGINYTAVQDGKNPALVGFIETSVYEKAHDKRTRINSWLLGATTYKAIDPVVLSLTAAYRLNKSKSLSDGSRYKAGNYWLLSPSVSFAANEKISLTGGVQWLGKQPDRIENKKESFRNTSMYADFGVGIGFTKNTSINVATRFNISGENSSEIKMGVQHTF